MDMKRRTNESEEQYLWRLGVAKDSGTIDITWDGIADLMNTEFRADETEYLSSSAYRKAYQQARRFYEAGVFTSLSEDKYLEKIKEAKRELEKEKVKFRDERNEYNKIVREEARRESYKEQVLRAIAEFECKPLQYVPSTDEFEHKDCSMVISFTDVHTGIDINSPINVFNEEVLWYRIKKYIDKIRVIQDRHCATYGYIVLSELISGLIHTTLRIENNQNLIQQFLTVTRYLADFLVEMDKLFEETYVVMAPGNHSRISPKPEDSLRGENMDILAMPYLKAVLQNYEHIHFIDNKYDEYVAIFGVENKVAMAVHGDKDNLSDVVQKLTMYTGRKPDFVFMGHRHTNAMSTVYDTKVIQSGTIASTDNFAMNLKLKNKPEQTVCIINKDGLDCLYDIKLI